MFYHLVFFVICHTAPGVLGVHHMPQRYGSARACIAAGMTGAANLNSGGYHGYFRCANARGSSESLPY